MILEHLAGLNCGRVILASASPRRREILQNVGLKVEVIPSKFEENLSKGSFGGGAAYAQATASAKAQEVARGIQPSHHRPCLVIGADTVVEQDNCIFEKPADASDARRMLSRAARKGRTATTVARLQRSNIWLAGCRLSGKLHHVHTGVALIALSGSGTNDAGVNRSFAITTSVEFAELSSSEIAAYIATGECFGKAGAYGIQGPAGVWVRRIEGCYFNVMGFPVHAFAAEVAHLIREELI